MNIYYDNIVFSLQKSGGISTYWGELSRRLIYRGENVQFLECINNNVINNSINIDPKLIINEKRYPFLINRFNNAKSPLFHNKFIFHSSYNRLSKNKNALSIITVHDLIHEKMFNGLKKRIHCWQKEKAIKNADRIIVVSENTKNDLIEYYPYINNDKINVVYNGVSEHYYPIPGIKISKNKNKPYLIYVGSRVNYKNFDFVLHLLQILLDFNLYIVGPNLSKKEIYLLQKLLPDRWKQFNNVSNIELNFLYNGAYALIYPSSYEGFGIPLLEAMKCGIPFVALNRSSIPEVAGKAGILVNDLNIFDFKDAIMSIDLQRESLIQNGYIQVKKFSWDKCFEETYNIYKELYKI